MTQAIAQNSTNVRADYPSAPAPAVLGWLERHAPKLTLALAEHWFFRPGKRRAGLDFGSAERTFEVDVQGVLVRVAGWGTGPHVIGAHGWAGSGRQFQSVRRRVVDAGYSFWTFDMPGHGATAGSSAHVGLFASTIAAVTRRLGDVHAVIGHSLGATAAALAVSRGVHLGGVVLIAPMPSVDFALEGFTQWAGLSGDLRDALKRRALTRASLSESEQSLFELPHHPERALLIHDRSDRMVPVQQSRALARRWAHAELFETDERGHNRVLKDPLALDEVCRFLHRLPRSAQTPLERHFSALNALSF